MLASLQPQQIKQSITKALKQWGDLVDEQDEYLTNLLLVQEELKGKDRAFAAAQLLAINSMIDHALSHLEQRLPMHAAVLKHRFLQKLTREETAAKLVLTPNQVKHLQSEALTALSETVISLEMALRKQTVEQLLTKLPSKRYTQLEGVNEIQQRLLARLLDNSTYTIIVKGIGGIGKTTLTDSTVRLVLAQHRFRNVVWIDATYGQSAETDVAFTGSPDAIAQQLLNGLTQFDGTSSNLDRSQRLKELLHAQPTLIVVDNLETRAAVEQVVRYLQNFINPSKLLLTSRVFPLDGESIFQLDVPELDSKHSAELMRHHAKTIGCQDITSASNQELNRIYARIGGNPLALRLVVSLLMSLSIDDVLDDLVEVEGQDIYALYHKIYWSVWSSLSEDAKTVLQVMPLATERGFQKSFLQELCELPAARLSDVLTELVRHSLLEPRGTIHDRWYSLHRLTESFLLKQVNRWVAIDG